jgi:hypothetical protein
MMERLHQAQVCIDWVVADTVSGNNLDLRTWLEDQGYWYALAVANTEEIGVLTPDGPRLLTVKQAEQLLIQPQDWQRLSVRTGTKGPLFFDWACLPILLLLTAINGRQKRHILADKLKHSSSAQAELKKPNLAESAKIKQFLAESANFTNGFHRLLTASQHLAAIAADNRAQDSSVKTQSEKQLENRILAEAAINCR